MRHPKSSGFVFSEASEVVASALLLANVGINFVYGLMMN
jgi:hypothetical protein